METPASQTGIPASPASAGELSLQPRSAVAWGSILLLVTVVVFWALLRSQFEFAIRFPSDWGHTLIVPLLSGWLVMRDRAKLEAMQPFKPSWVGLLAAVAGLSFYLVSLVGPSWFTVHHNARQLGFGLYLFGTALLLFGWRPMRVLFFPLAYLVVFGFTYTDRIIGYFTQQLQDISAYGGYVMLVVIGLDVEIQGNTIYVGTGALNIAEACSGMRMLVAFMALGTLMAYIGLKAWWQRALLIALGVPVAVFVNMLRVATLGVLSLWDTGLAGGQFHAFVGFVWLVPAFLVFLGLMAIVQRLVIDVETPKEKAA